MTGTTYFLLYHKFNLNSYIIFAYLVAQSDEQAKLDTILSQTFGTFFLGLEFNPVTNTYAWVNGDSLNGDINHWDHYQPDPSEDRNCAKVSPESYGFWWMSKCDETASYICEYPRKGYTVPPTTTTTVAPEAQCPSYEWTKVGDQCFRLFTQELTFSKAEDYCQTVGGHLASLHSADEETNALNEQSNYGYYFLWIGLRQNSDGSDGGYYWTDDSPLDYSPYKSKSFKKLLPSASSWLKVHFFLSVNLQVGFQIPMVGWIIAF